MAHPQGKLHFARYLFVGLLIGLAAYWAGARWGPRQPVSVEALPMLQSRGGGTELTPDEAVNVRVYQQASPAVANIVTRTVAYDFFFGAVPSEGAGSGFLIDAEGHILTNFHVVQGAERIEVALGEQRRFEARLVGVDQHNDVALLKIATRGRTLPFLPLGDSDKLQVGQRVLAIGNPFGMFQSTLTTGVISAMGRTVQTSDNTFIDRAIQTDAAINRGNSGGPLLNTHGDVIGINTAIFTPSGTTAGIGFAIPINSVKRIVQDLLTIGRVRRADLGIEGPQEMWPEMAEALKLPAPEGLLIARVTPGGPAARAGVRGGDRMVQAGLWRVVVGGDLLVAVDGNKIGSRFDLELQLNRKRPGDTITLTLYRGLQKMDVRVTLGEQ